MDGAGGYVGVVIVEGDPLQGLVWAPPPHLCIYICLTAQHSEGHAVEMSQIYPRSLTLNFPSL